MDVFFAQKTRQFAEMGVKDVFDVHARAFYREVAQSQQAPSRISQGRRRHRRNVQRNVCHNRMAVSLSSLAEGEVQRFSPGGLLLRHQIKEACEEGLALYAMGVGEARHKTEWCEITQPLFDSFIALKPQGLILTQAFAVMARASGSSKPIAICGPW
ncbi:MAG: GNAT family N-acetyltransferase [Methyloceanibacter sp.]|uniref:GNAT family N-acetyltransferase n=1 Tax=Methyloceanibacter sp. TaxID=1965321 RepID=UPI003D9BEBBD